MSGPFFAAALYIKKTKKTRIHCTENERLSKVTYANSSFTFESEFCLKAEINLIIIIILDVTRTQPGKQAGSKEVLGPY